MEAMTRAVEMVYPGGCNQGFIREESVLVVILLTTAEENESEWDTQTWRDALTIAKRGEDSRIVVVGIIGDSDGEDPVCEGNDAEAAPRLREFVESYGEQGVTCSVCAEDYHACLTQALPAVVEACTGPLID